MRRLCSSLVLLALQCPLQAQAVTTTTPVVIASFDHDPEAFTQGLFYYEGSLFESTGLEGRSTLREVVPETGEVLRSVALPADEFGEGIARVGDMIWMLTWREGVAHKFALDDFEPLGDVSYEGEGWGLCFDGERLVMSDGSSSLQFRDPDTFELLGERSITRDGAPISNLNELECVGRDVYANVWRTDLVLQIDPQSGEVLSQINASGLLDAEQAEDADVLNGIAYDAQSGHFFLAGKLWPKLFEVELAPESAPRPVPLPPCNPHDDAGAPDPVTMDTGVADMAGADAQVTEELPAEAGAFTAAAPPARNTSPACSLGPTKPGSPGWGALALLAVACALGARTRR